MRKTILMLAGAVLASGLFVQANAAENEPRTGEAIYESACKICHAAGVAGAPQAGSEQWVSRLAAKGMQGLVSSVKNGLNVMPAMGMCGDCSDQELINVIQYMLPKDKPM